MKGASAAAMAADNLEGSFTFTGWHAACGNPDNVSATTVHSPHRPLQIYVVNSATYES
jgi:hypothetical protein